MMMKTRLTSTLSLLAVLIASCAAQAPASPPAVAQGPVIVAPTATEPPPSALTAEQVSQPAAGPTQELAPTPFPVATSRGPNLEAIDPSTVSLASGNVQFVEFFRFT